MLTLKPLPENISLLKIRDEKLKILHLEDLNSDALLISKAIKKGGIDFKMLVVDTRDKFIKALREFSPDIILSDHSLPSFNSIEAMEIFHETGIMIPFILVTATTSEEFAVDVIKRGADDYILKDRLHRLPHAIINAVEKYRFEKERRQLMEEAYEKEAISKEFLRKNAEEREILLLELTKSIKDLKQFTYITSHNFKAPLSNLIGLLNLIDDNSVGANNKVIIDMFKTATQQLNKTINDLVQILIIRNNVNLEVADINISNLLNEVYNSFQYEIKENNCTINTDLKVDNILYHKSYLESILMNLVSNAIKYRSPLRPLQINITTAFNAEGEVFLTVQDNGSGIDLKRHQNSIFGLYQRFHSNPDGVGLGLFIVKSQITALGGSIKVASEVDKGTTFTITFKDKMPVSSNN
ncbi:MAG: Histidine kinase [Segetibacter sp.]|nr:Histidine kinase [Segetibacter sp.]